MDRLDYLKRDSFFTGVTEGNIGVDRIISMLDIKDDKLVIEEKGIYSIEKFIIARRLMYWQVYLHKTVLSAENMLIQILNRAKYIHENSKKIYLSPDLKRFFKNSFSFDDFIKDDSILENFSRLDDYEIYACLKYWIKNEDFVLSNLSQKILDRDILKIKIQKTKFNKKTISAPSIFFSSRLTSFTILLDPSFDKSVASIVFFLLSLKTRTLILSPG